MVHMQGIHRRFGILLSGLLNHSLIHCYDGLATEFFSRGYHLCVRECMHVSVLQ